MENTKALTKLVNTLNKVSVAFKDKDVNKIAICAAALVEPILSLCENNGKEIENLDIPDEILLGLNQTVRKFALFGAFAALSEGYKQE